jgi:YD repeat-containing protein
LEYLAHDTSGNLLPRPGQTQAWDAENRLASVTQGGVTTTFTYDGDGNRVKVAVGNVITVYVGSTYEVNPTSGVTTTYCYAGSQPPGLPAGGRRVAMRIAACVTWLTRDHLGSAAPPVPAPGRGRDLGPAWPGPWHTWFRGRARRQALKRPLRTVAAQGLGRPEAPKCPLRTLRLHLLPLDLLTVFAFAY